MSVIHRRRWSIHAAHRVLLSRHRGVVSSLLWRVIASLAGPGLSRCKARIDKAALAAREEPRGAKEGLLAVADSPTGKGATDEEVQRYESDEGEEENPFDEHACLLFERGTVSRRHLNDALGWRSIPTYASVPEGVAVVDVAVAINVDNIVVITLGERGVQL